MWESSVPTSMKFAMILATPPRASVPDGPETPVMAGATLFTVTLVVPVAFALASATATVTV